MEFDCAAGAFCGTVDVVEFRVVDGIVGKEVEVVFAVVVEAMVVVEDVVYVVDEETVVLELAPQTAAELSSTAATAAMTASLLGNA